MLKFPFKSHYGLLLMLLFSACTKEESPKSQPSRTEGEKIGATTKAKTDDEVEEKAKAEAETKNKAEAEAKTKAEAEAKTKAEAKAKADADAKAKAAEKATIAGVDVEKFKYPEEKVVSEDDYHSKSHNIEKLFGNIKTDKSADTKEMKGAIDKIKPEDINIKRDKKGSSLLYDIVEHLKSPLIIDFIADDDAIRHDIERKVIIPLLKKGANPHLRTLKSTGFFDVLNKFVIDKKLEAEAANQFILALKYFEPNKPVKKVVDKIIDNITNKIDDLNVNFDKTGKEALKDLDMLVPYFTTEDSRDLALSIVKAFSGKTLDEKAIVTDSPSDTAGNFHSALLNNSKNIADLNLPLLARIYVLRNLIS